AEPFWSEPDRIMVRHGQTYAGHATVCAAGLANLAIIEREGLLSRGRDLEDDLYGALSALADHPVVGEGRGGGGLMAAVQLADDVLAADSHASTRFFEAVRANGVLTRPHAIGMAISPPLTITVDEIQTIGDTVRAGLDELANVVVG